MYHNGEAEKKYFRVSELIQDLIDTMPIITVPVADRLAERQIDTKEQAVANSIFGKIKAIGSTNIENTIKYTMSQKKDSLYD